MAFSDPPADPADRFGSAVSLVNIDPGNGKTSLIADGFTWGTNSDVGFRQGNALAVEPGGAIDFAGVGADETWKLFRYDPVTASTSVLLASYFTSLAAAPDGTILGIEELIDDPSGENLLVRIDPRTGNTTPLLTVSNGFIAGSALTVEKGGVVDFNVQGYSSVAPTLTRFDPATGERYVLDPSYYDALAAAPDGSVIGLQEHLDDPATPFGSFSVERLDPATGNRTTLVPVSAGYSFGNVVTAEADGTIDFSATTGGGKVYHLYHLDPATGAGGPLNGTFFSGLASAPSPPLAVTVPSPYSDQPADSREFGPYLAGVTLLTPFTVTASPASGIASVKLHIDGLPPGSGDNDKVKTLDASSHTATFKIDMGLFTKAGDPHLTATALDATGKPIAGITFPGIVHVRDQLDFKLQAAPALGPSSLIDARNLRLIDGIATLLSYTATIANLPLADLYKDRLGVTFVNDQTKVPLDAPVDFKAFTKTGTATFTYSTSFLHDVIKSDGFDNDVFLTPRGKFGSPKTHLSAPQHILVVTAPSWLNKGTPSFLDGAYVFNGLAPATAQLGVQTPAIPSIPWLNSQVQGTTNAVTMMPNLSVAIPLDRTQEAKATVNSLTVNLKLLDQPVWSQVYASSAVTSVLKLNPTTLQPDDLKLTLNKVPQTVSTKTFLKQTFKVPIVTPLTPVVTITAGLALQITGTLKVNGASLEWAWTGSQLTWVSSGTFIDLLATATGSVTAQGKATVAGGWLGTYTASGTVSATLSLQGKAQLGGLITSPQLVSPALLGTLKGSYFYSFDGILGPSKATATEKDAQNQPDGTFGPVTLFNL